MELVAFVLMLILFFSTVAAIFAYVKTTDKLLGAVEKYAPEVWDSLGRPKKVFVRGGSSGGMETIQPIWPWLGWIWEGKPKDLQAGVLPLYWKTRHLFFRCFGMFFSCVVLFLVFFALVS